MIRRRQNVPCNTQHCAVTRRRSNGWGAQLQGLGRGGGIGEDEGESPDSVLV
ncbi:hypothetical protein CGRA01v4_13375 [Colletotrichum graminicola]|nr:hypothetical protein CGRA01v4_13375 [Colletotrichum graminicola]